MITLLIFSLVALGIVIYFFITDLHPPTLLLFIVALFFVVMIIYIVLFEFRKKALKVKVDGKHVCTRNYLGLGKEREIALNDFDGFITSFLNSEYNSYEYLFLVKGRKRVYVISEYYHYNYFQIKNAISGHLKFLRTEKYGLRQVLLDILD